VDELNDQINTLRESEEKLMSEFKEIQDKNKQIKEVSNNKINELNKEIKTLRELINSQKDFNEVLKERAAKCEEYKDKLLKLTEQIPNEQQLYFLHKTNEELSSKLTDVNNELVSLKEKNAELIESDKQMKELINSKEIKYSKAKEKLLLESKELKVQLDKRIVDEEEYKIKIAELEDKLKERLEEANENKTVQTDVLQDDEQLSELSKSKEDEIIKLQDNVDQLNAKLKDNMQIMKEYELRIKEQQKLIEDKDLALIQEVNKTDELTNSSTLLNEAINELQLTIEKSEKDKEQQQELIKEKELEIQKVLEEKDLEVKEYQETIEKLKECIEEKESNIRELHKADNDIIVAQLNKSIEEKETLLKQSKEEREQEVERMNIEYREKESKLQEEVLGLHKSLEESENVIKKFTKQIEELINIRSQYEEEVEELKEECERLTRLKAEQESTFKANSDMQFKELEDKIKLSEEAQETNDLRIEELQKENAEKEKVISDQKKIIEDINNEKNGFKQIIESLTNQVQANSLSMNESLSKLKKQHSNQLTKLEEELKIEQEKATTSENQRLEINAEKQSLIRTNEETRNHLQTKLREITELIKENNTLTKTVNALKVQVDTLTSDKEAALKEIKDLKEEMSNVFVKLKEKHNNTIKEAETLKEQLAEKDRELKERQVDGESIGEITQNKELDDLRNENVTLKEKLQSEIEKHNKLMGTIEKSSEELNAEIAELKIKNEKLKKENTVLDKTANSLTEKFTNMALQMQSALNAKRELELKLLKYENKK